jgi:predicted transcriptional regulator YdeE
VILEEDFTDMKAQETVYHSATFSRLADFSTKLYRKTWQEIYEQFMSQPLAERMRPKTFEDYIGQKP